MVIGGNYFFLGNVNECGTALVKNLIKESFYGKRKKKQLIFWLFISFPIKVMSKLS